MSSRNIVSAAVFVLCLTCAVGAVAQVQPTCDSLLNPKSAVQANASSGDAYVQFCLGLAYEAGQIVPRDYSKAMAWYRKAAEQGEKYAQYNLGSMYNNGEGVTQDYAQAAVWFLKSAEQGLDRAQYTVGRMYHNGQGVPQDYAQARIWYQKAAEQEMANRKPILPTCRLTVRAGRKTMCWPCRGFARQRTKDGRMPNSALASCTTWAKECPKIMFRPRRGIKKVAQKGNYQAQSNLGFMYSNGLGVARNYAEAYFWFAIAASAGIESAEQKQTIKLRDDAASHLTPAVLSREQKRVSDWFEGGD